MNYLPVCPAHKLPDTTPEHRWLVEGLWSYEAVGIIGGEPKCGKSLLALSIAVSVASGMPCLNKFKVSSPGRVLLLAAEDSLPAIKNRIASISLAHGVSLSTLPIFVVTTPSIRLDIASEYESLKNTVQKLAPRLIILDPFVRFHRADENSAGDVAPLLSNLRYLQRSFHSNVIVVHHARKDSKHTRQGQALRGSSEFHAWGDSNLYLRRKLSNSISLTVEHRNELSPQPILLSLAANEVGPFHQIVDTTSEHPSESLPAEQKILQLLSSSSALTASQIRQATKLRNQVVSQTLKNLLSRGLVSHSPLGYSPAT